MGFFEGYQRWCAIDKLHELWHVEYDIIEEYYIQVVELRGIDAGHEVLQIFADSLETKQYESGED